jgi:hypothetical protein
MVASESQSITARKKSGCKELSHFVWQQHEYGRDDNQEK